MALEIYTDGGCSGNPGPGGWAYIVVDGSSHHSASGFEAETTNNRMELTAVLEALHYAAGLHDGTGSGITVHTDSQYVKRGITEWILTWERNGWKTAGKKPVKNQDLWKSLKHIADTVPVSWKWLKGHAGDPLNERCDALVQEAIANGRSP
jgi:ribonuclease HI